MYDVFVGTVKSVDSEKRVGGPACYHEYFLKSFLNHVTNGINYVTGKKGTQIDFISYHIYGLSGKWLNKALIFNSSSAFYTFCLVVTKIIKIISFSQRDSISYKRMGAFFELF